MGSRTTRVGFDCLLPIAYCPKPNASRPVSRVLYGRRPCSRRRDGHSSGAPVAGRLEQPTRATDLRTGPALLAGRASLLFGFAPGGACLAADVAADAVRSCRTLSPLPAIGRRFAFCGAVPEIALAGRYPAPCPHGARTFLRPKATAVRPTDGTTMRLPAVGSSAATHWPGLRRIKTAGERLA